LNGNKYECPSSGGIIKIDEESIIGSIVCPDFYLICNQTVPCANLLDCANKKSLRIENNSPLNKEFIAGVYSNLSSTSLSKEITVAAKN